MIEQRLNPTPQAPTRPNSARFVDTWASVHLDALRAIAALLVLLEHWRNLFFVDYPQLAGHKALWSVPYVLSGAGHQAVIVFFVLSGFFIGGTVLRAVEKRQWSWPSYLVRRGVRLWVVLLPALVACLFWDKLGLRLGFAPALYHGSTYNHMLPNISRMLSPRLFVINLFFLQSSFGQPFGSDGALWSLAFEFWYYILFPLMVLAALPWMRAGQRVLCAGLLVAIAWFVGPGILLSFPIWLAGVALVRLPALRMSPAALRRMRTAAPFVYAPIFFYLAKTRLFSSLVNDYVLTVFTFLFLWILLSASGVPPLRSVRVKVSREFARFSYTLYAVHVPMLVFVASLVVHDARWQPTPLHVLAGGGVLLAAVAYAFGVAWLTEFRTDALRMRVERVLGIGVTASELRSNPTDDDTARGTTVPALARMSAGSER
jgi:peptidoglycan/LPS O-acetylase OafA/YrhL